MVTSLPFGTLTAHAEGFTSSPVLLPIAEELVQTGCGKVSEVSSTHFLIAKVMFIHTHTHTHTHIKL